VSEDLVEYWNTIYRECVQENLEWARQLAKDMKPKGYAVGEEPTPPAALPWQFIHMTPPERARLMSEDPKAYQDMLETIRGIVARGGNHG